MYRTALWVPVGLLAVACNSENTLGDAYTEPLLRLENPGEAAWMDVGPVTARGTAIGLEDLEVAGAQATIDGDKFSADLTMGRGLNLVEARGTDGHGSPVFVRHGVLAGDFGAPTGPIAGATVVRLNQGGLDTVLGMVSDQFTASTVQGALASANPVYQDAYGVWGWDAVTVRADITGVWFDPMELRATPTPSVLKLDAVIPDFYVGLNVSGDVVGLDFSVDAALWADYVDVTGDIALSASNGKLSVDLRNTHLQFTGFGWDTSLIPGDVESWLLVDTVGDLVASQLSSQIDQQVPALLEDALSQLELSYDTDLLGRQVHVEGSFASAGVDAQGVQLGLDLGVDIPGTAPHPYEGYLLATPAVPTVDRTADIGMSVSDDLMNRVLFEAWGSGLLQMTLSTDDGSLDPAMLTLLKADQGTITVDAQLPPVLVEKDRGLQAQLGELLVTIDTPGGELGEHIVLSVSVLADVDMKVVNGVLKLDVGEPAIQLVVRDSDWGASNEATTTLLENTLPVDAFLALLGDIEFPLPELAGISVTQATVSRDASGVYTGIRADLN